MDDGTELALTQPSARRRDYELRRGDQVIGRLRFPPGGRSAALADGAAIGSFTLTGSRGRVVARRAPRQAAIATVEREHAGAAVIRLAGRPPLAWRRAGRRQRWAIAAGDVALLEFSAAHGLLRASVWITTHQELPEPTAVLLCLVGGFLALGGLQAEADAGAAVGGIVASGAG